jgi:hypothetical protein
MVTAARLSHVPLRRLHQQVRQRVGQRVDWLRIYIVNEEEILLAGDCPSGATQRRVVEAVRKAAPAVRLRNAIGVRRLRTEVGRLVEGQGELG